MCHCSVGSVKPQNRGLHLVLLPKIPQAERSSQSSHLGVQVKRVYAVNRTEFLAPLNLEHSDPLLLLWGIMTPQLHLPCAAANAWDYAQAHTAAAAPSPHTLSLGREHYLTARPTAKTGDLPVLSVLLQPVARCTTRAFSPCLLLIKLPVLQVLICNLCHMLAARACATHAKGVRVFRPLPARSKQGGAVLKRQWPSALIKVHGSVRDRRRRRGAILAARAAVMPAPRQRVLARRDSVTAVAPRPAAPAAARRRTERVGIAAVP